MKKWFENVKDWFHWNTENIIMAAIIAFTVLVIIALVIALIVGINAFSNIDTISKETAWLINPVNPASPVHWLP